MFNLQAEDAERLHTQRTDDRGQASCEEEHSVCPEAHENDDGVPRLTISVNLIVETCDVSRLRIEIESHIDLVRPNVGRNVSDTSHGLAPHVSHSRC